MRYFDVSISLAALVAGTCAWPLEQIPLVDEVASEVDAPGIGFDLSARYGTAAIKYRNGTVIDVGQVQGGWEYQYLMQKLSEKGWPFSPPFDNKFDEMKWSSQQVERKLRKLRGLPATEEIGILSSMISALQYITQDKLSTPVTQVAVTIPPLPMLLSSDLEEAFDHAGIKQLRTGYRPLDEAIAARAGMGYGLCANPDNPADCEDEELRMPDKFTVAISFTNTSLVVRNLLIYRGHTLISGVAEEMDYLGFSNSHHMPDFWDRIGAQIRATAGLFWAGAKVNELVLYGEAAEEKKFLDEVWKALGDLQDQGLLRSSAADTYAEMVQRVDFNATYISARGAAEFARRLQGVSRKFFDDTQEALLNSEIDEVALNLQAGLIEYETLIAFTLPAAEGGWHGRINNDAIAKLGLEPSQEIELRRWIPGTHEDDTQYSIKVRNSLLKEVDMEGLEEFSYLIKLVRVPGLIPELILAFGGSRECHVPLGDIYPQRVDL